MTIENLIQQKKISEILHFTTSHGILGILSERQLLPRSMLPEKKQLEFIMKNNCETRRDDAWFGYVNLSITRINQRLYNISSDNWHANNEQLWWCILSFKPEILTHAGVFFATTNNMYTGVQRRQSIEGLESLFAPKVNQFKNNYATRETNRDDNLPTCPQAEVLYPGAVSLDHLLCIYVKNDEHKDILHGQLAIFSNNGIEIKVQPDIFREKA